MNCLWYHYQNKGSFITHLRAYHWNNHATCTANDGNNHAIYTDKIIWNWVGIFIRDRKTPFIDGLVQECSISIANALEILQSCTKPSISGSNITWYWTQCERKKSQTLLRLWTPKDTPYLTLIGELWDVNSEFFGEMIPQDIKGALSIRHTCILRTLMDISPINYGKCMTIYPLHLGILCHILIVVSKQYSKTLI